MNDDSKKNSFKKTRKKVDQQKQQVVDRLKKVGIIDNNPVLMNEYAGFMEKDVERALQDGKVVKHIAKSANPDNKIPLIKRLPHQSSPSFTPFFQLPDSYTFENQKTIPKILHFVWISPKKIIGPDGIAIPRTE
jgi:mannosyltransferase OCH1-like enzyme